MSPTASRPHMATPLLHDSWHDFALPRCPPSDELAYMPMQHMNRILAMAARLFLLYHVM